MFITFRRAALGACALALVSLVNLVQAGFDPNIRWAARNHPVEYFTVETLTAELARNIALAGTPPAAAAQARIPGEAEAVKKEPGPEERKKILGAYGKLPLSFIENRGQVDPRVAFYLQRPGLSTYFTREGLVLSLSKGKGEEGRQHTIAVEFLAAQPQAIESLEKAQGIVSYFRGKPEEHTTGIPTHKKINYVQPWPGIDLAYDGAGGRLESFYTVAPHADPAQIRLRYRGATDLRLDAQGNLIYTTELGDLTETAPIAWQETGRNTLPDRGRHGFLPGRCLQPRSPARDRPDPRLLRLPRGQRH